MDADIVVAGAGHNSLIAACYLAKAGYRCLVLDARDVPGGGSATEELLLPGYKVDTCATGHTLIRVNPLLTRDELGLRRDYGLRYIDPDPVAHVAFPDGEQLTMWLDKERTIAEIARFSAGDARAYRRLLDDYDDVKSAFSGSQFTPVGFGPSLDQRLADHPRGKVWQRIRQLSPWDVIRHEFTDRHVQAFMLWMAFQTNQAVDMPGSGALAYSLVFGRQQRSWSILPGGSGTLIDALTRYLAEHGATIVCGKTVTRLISTATAASASRPRTARSTGRRRPCCRPSTSPTCATWRQGRCGRKSFTTASTPTTPASPASVCTWPRARRRCSKRVSGRQGRAHRGLRGHRRLAGDVIRLGEDLRAGRFVEDVPWLLVATPTLADPTRAPAGHHTVKLLSQNVYDVPDWDAAKLEHAKRQLAHLRKVGTELHRRRDPGPAGEVAEDYERLNPHMVHGAFHGGDRGIAQSGALRPAPGWGAHRMPVPGLYQTGATTHPGGSITGAPGRNAAMVLLHDLGRDPAEVMSLG